MERWSPETSVSVHLSASAPSPPLVLRAPRLTRLYSAEEESAFLFLLVFLFTHVFVCYTRGFLLGECCLNYMCVDLASRLVAGEHISDTAVTRVELRCSAAAPRPTGDSKQASPHPASMSRNRSVLSWSLSGVGALTTEASSVLTAAASGF